MSMEKATELTQVDVALRAKVGVVWIKTVEETRVERALWKLCLGRKYQVFKWTVTTGLDRVGNNALGKNNESTRDFQGALRSFLMSKDRAVMIACDVSPWVVDPINLRFFKETHVKLLSLDKSEAKQVVVIDAGDPPAGLVGVTVVDWSLPGRAEMSQVVDAFVNGAPESVANELKEENSRDTLVSALMGLTAEDAMSAMSRSLAGVGKVEISLVAREKERVVRGSGLEWYESKLSGLEDVGGLAVLKRWLLDRRSAFSVEARQYGLPAPKGVMLLGVPGCGKSLICKSIAAAWGLPLLRMDVGALFSKYVGESEGKIRTALRTAEVVAPCILWLDEVEKAFGSSNESDGGTSSRVFGTFLTWMQERQEGVFVVATSNDISKLPPEFLRAGRWDEVWFVDLPRFDERIGIVEVLRRRLKNCDSVAPELVAKASNGYSGAEIEQAFIDAMFMGFSAKRPVTTGDLVSALGSRVPLQQTMREKIDALRKWAVGRARFASVLDEETKL